MATAATTEPAPGAPVLTTANDAKIKRLFDTLGNGKVALNFGFAIYRGAYFVSFIDGEGDSTLYVWTAHDLIRWHQAVVEKRYALEAETGKEGTWEEAFKVVPWPASRAE